MALLHIMLIVEILATTLGIHCVYGKKLKWDIRTIGFVVCSAVVLEVINLCQVNGIFSFATYIIIMLYCKSEFKSTMAEAVISTMLTVIIMACVQFICLVPVNMVLADMILVRNTLCNILLLIVCITILPKMGFHRLQKALCKRSRYVFSLFGFICVIVIIMLLQEKVFNGLQIQNFVLVVPAIIVLLYSFMKWYTAQSEAEKMEEEIRRVEETTKEYDSLLTNVRLRQHEFKNHMAAIYSTHYTHKTYEELVQAQEEYCEKLLEENKYNGLLLLGNNVLAGYLYGKFQETEAIGIDITYKVSAKVDRSQVPTYHIIEMLGILLDNASEALKTSEEKAISFEVCETQQAYQFSVMNPFHYVSYDEISEWFQFEKSEKGSGRGLGLYHLKSLCDEWKCDIGCRNMEINENNWIVFTLKIGKAEE